MKYNDIAVTRSSWEELVRDSFGGYRNASAYCLMYINDKKPFLIEGEPSGGRGLNTWPEGDWFITKLVCPRGGSWALA